MFWRWKCTHQLSITGVWGGGWEGRLSFSNRFWRERERGGRGRGESFTSCSPPSHKQSAEPQRSAGALVNKRPTYQWSGEGGAGMAFKRRLHGVWGAGAGEGPARCLYIQWRPGRTITNHKVQYSSNALKPELHITCGALCCTENRPDMSDCKWTIMM